MARSVAVKRAKPASESPDFLGKLQRLVEIGEEEREKQREAVE